MTTVCVFCRLKALAKLYPPPAPTFRRTTQYAQPLRQWRFHGIRELSSQHVGRSSDGTGHSAKRTSHRTLKTKAGLLQESDKPKDQTIEAPSNPQHNPDVQGPIDQARHESQADPDAYSHDEVNDAEHIRQVNGVGHEYGLRWTPHSFDAIVKEELVQDDRFEEEGEPHDINSESLPSETPLEDLAAAIESIEVRAHEEGEPTPEMIAQAARQAFGDTLPEGALNEEQYQVYERLYGVPVMIPAEGEEVLEEDDRDVLYKEGKDGMLEEIGALEPDVDTSEETIAAEADEVDDMDRMEEARDVDAEADAQLQRDIAAAIAAREGPDTGLTIRSPGDLMAYEEQDLELEEDTLSEPGVDPRGHPFTVASRFGTSPSAVPLPRSSFVEPVAHLLSNISNKHLDDVAHRIFGGPGLPYSPSTPFVSRTKPQKPIPLHATQGKMSDIEADVYLAAVMPQTYASVISVLVETRKRLGAKWLEGLLRREGGPRILDIGAGGAGVIAWREILKAEWKRMHDIPDANPNDTASASDQKPTRNIPPTPLGKATVLTGSSSLRLRASALLENTTFLPRLPDYVHASFPSEDSQRKQFDIIVAPHSLWHMHEAYERRQLVKNLWNFLDPNGGVLVLLEKGVPRGFEVIADARAFIMSQLFEKAEGEAENIEEPEYEDAATDTVKDEAQPDESGNRRLSPRSPAHIVAPCPHSQRCPLYLVKGVSRQRKDWCHFRQRYVRPPYLQRLLGARDRNFDDVEFSYVALQKGLTNTAPLQGLEADERAFAGYEVDDEDVIQQPEKVPHPFGSQYVQPPQQIKNPLPRLLLQPLKRQGHIHLDMCTPAGTFSRWTVPRSYGKQAYRDARKASWGDLWALGAKQKEDRRVRLGLKGMQAGIGTGRGAKSKTKVKSKVGGPIKDVKGKSTSTGPISSETEEGEASRREERKQRRRAAKNRGREKARSRRREETKALFAGGDV